MSDRNARHATWQRLLAEQQASGISITAWCAQQHIQAGTFYAWRKRLAASAPSAVPQWVAVEPRASGTASGVTLRLGQLAVEVVSGFDPHVLAAVLTVLEAR